ncbi:MAG: hypothetical protein ABWZ54_02685 [Luteibacter sp.]
MASTSEEFASENVHRAPTFEGTFDIGVMLGDCGIEPAVQRYDAAADAVSWPLIDYSSCPPTDDQMAINRWLARAPLAGKRILHVGAGNSSIARLLADDVDAVVAVTVSVNEWRHAQTLDLPGYTPLLMNKHSEAFASAFGAGSFDYIVDNNLSSFACCQRHFERYVAAIADALADDGVILTHWLGMRWVLDVGVDDVESAWLLDETKLRTIATAFGLRLDRDGDLFFLRHAGRSGPSVA